MINLIMGNCRDQLVSIPDKSIDLVIIDPPYEQSRNGGGGAFGAANRNYFSEISDISDGIDNDLLDLIISKQKKINIYIYCNKKQLLQYLTYFSNKNTTFDLLSWHKSNPIPATSNIYLRDTEYILFFREHGVKLYGDYHSKKTYFISPVNKSDKKLYGHPTVKPLNQCETFIINSSVEGDTVLDCFMGTGTVGVACKKLNRNFIGMEINPEYYNIAKSRINNS